MSKLRILCTADLHLGKSSAVPIPVPDLDISADAAWGRIVDMAIIEGAHAVVIAGDIFEGLGSYVEARTNFLKGLRELDRREIPVIAVSGNHDWNVLPQLRNPPKNFFFLGKSGVWENIRLSTPKGDVIFLGWSFPSATVDKSQLASLEMLRADCPVVGILHGDTTPRSPYHPISDSELRDRADVWVVGHVHKPSWIGVASLYPGSPQAFDFGPGERGCHGVRWLEIEAGVPHFSELVPISNVRFEVLELLLDLEPGKSPEDLALDTLQQKCLDLCKENSATESVHLRAHVTVTGEIAREPVRDRPLETYLDRHSIEIVSLRTLHVVDPWTLKDLRDMTGEAARLLIGATALGEEETEGNEIPESWIQDARKLVESSAKDIEFHFRRTMATVADQGESAGREPDQDEVFEMAHSLLIEELQDILQRAAH